MQNSTCITHKNINKTEEFIKGTGWHDYIKDDWFGIKSLWTGEQETGKGGEMGAMGYAG